MSEIPPQIPPKFESNYPRQSQVDMSYVRPPGVYFDAIGIAFKMIQANIGVYVASTLLSIVPIIGVSLLFSAINIATMGMPDPRHPYAAQFGPVQILGQFVTQAASIFGILGLISIGVQHAKGQTPAIGDFFIPFRRFGTVLLASLVWVLPTVIIYAGMFASLGSASSFSLLPGVIACGILLMIMYVLFIGPYYMAMTRAVFSEVGPIQAYADAIKGLGGGFFLFSVLVIVTGILAGLGVLACCVGILFTYPILTNTIALHYLYYFPPSRESIQQFASGTPG